MGRRAGAGSAARSDDRRPTSHPRRPDASRPGADPRDATTHKAIPVTTVPRTLVDLAAVLDAETSPAPATRPTSVIASFPPQVDAALARCTNAKGAAALRRVLHGDERVTLSWLERRFLARLRAAHLPLPQTNRSAGGRFVDCRWPAHHLTVELDSYRYHRSRHAWEQDRRREREAYARGDDFRRYTYDDVSERAEPMLAELEPLLRASPRSAAPRG